MNFAALNEKLKVAIALTVRTHLASELDCLESAIKVELFPGSIQVRASIELHPEKLEASSDVVAKLNETTTYDDLVKLLNNLPGVDKVITGDLFVGGIKTVLHGATTLATTTLLTLIVTHTFTTKEMAVTTQEEAAGIMSAMVGFMGGNSVIGWTIIFVLGILFFLSMSIVCRYCWKGRSKVKTNLWEEDEGEDEDRFTISGPAQTFVIDSTDTVNDVISTRTGISQVPPRDGSMSPPWVATSIPSGADRSTQDISDGPGTYEIIVDFTAVGPSVALGSVITELEEGTFVDVLEVVNRVNDKRVRGRIRSPAGWISLCSTEDPKRWARRVDAGSQRPAPLTPTRATSPVGGVSVGSAPSSASYYQGSVAMSLPGDFRVGEQVMSLVDFQGASGSLSVGEVGFIAGPCRGYNGSGAKARVNCRFPRHANINLKVSQLRKLEGSGGVL